MPEIKKPEDYKLEEPEKPEGFEGKVLEISELLSRAEAERKTTSEPEYWQGRKDGLRQALAILEPGETIWNQLNDNSPGFRIEEKEGLLKLLEEARFNIGAALDDYEARSDRRIHSQTIINLLQWLDLYDRKAKKGELLPAEGAISPSWEGLTRPKRSRNGYPIHPKR